MLEIPWQLVVIVMVILFAFSALWRYAHRRSKTMVQTYREATPERRRDLDAAMDQDLDLESFMRPMPWWEVAIYLGGVAYLVYSAAKSG